MKCSPFLAWGGGSYATYRKVAEKNPTGNLYTSVSSFCASVQEQSNLKPYAQVCSRTAGS